MQVAGELRARETGQSTKRGTVCDSFVSGKHPSVKVTRFNKDSISIRSTVPETPRGRETNTKDMLHLLTSSKENSSSAQLISCPTLVLMEHIH